MVTLTLAAAPAELEQIIALQRRNHPDAVPPAQRQEQGFVTMEYTVAQLQSMCGRYRHAIAKAGDTVVGYALVMLSEQRADFPFLLPMFEAIDAASLNGRPVSAGNYVVMGQVCIDRAYRGQGLFRALYGLLRQQLQADFELIATEVSVNNARSLRAHRQTGFCTIWPEPGSTAEWQVLAWDWREAAAA